MEKDIYLAAIVANNNVYQVTYHGKVVLARKFRVIGRTKEITKDQAITKVKEIYSTPGKKESKEYLVIIPPALAEPTAIAQGDLWALSQLIPASLKNDDKTATPEEVYICATLYNTKVNTAETTVSSTPHLGYVIYPKSSSNDAENIPTELKSILLSNNKLVPIPLKLELQPDENMEEYLRIGYTKFTVPVSAINVREEHGLNMVDTMRSAGSIKELTKNASLLIDITFTITDQNSFNNILLPLLNQFRRTAFLPVTNIYLNDTWDISALALRDFSVSTVNGMPGVFTVTMVCEPFVWERYLVGHDRFEDAFCWPVFKYWCDKRSKCSPLGELNGLVSFTIPNVERIKEKTGQVAEVADLLSTDDTQSTIQQIIEIGKKFTKTQELDPNVDFVYETVDHFVNGRIPLRSAPIAAKAIQLALKYENVVVCYRWDEHDLDAQAVPHTVLKLWQKQLTTFLQTQDITALRPPNEDTWESHRDQLIFIANLGSLAWKTLLTSSPAVRPLAEDPLNYTAINFDDSVVISGVSAQFSTKLARLHPAGSPYPLHQYMGTGDMFISIQGTMVGEENVEIIKAMFAELRDLATHPVYGSEGKIDVFVGVQNDILNALGVTQVLPISLQVSMVPNHPGVYTFQIDMVEFEDTQHRKEAFKQMEEWVFKNIDIANGTVEISDSLKNDIRNSEALSELVWETVERRHYRHWLLKLMMKARELYPDMQLPTKNELGIWIYDLQEAANGRGSRLAKEALSIIPKNKYASIRQFARGDNKLGFEDPDFYCIPAIDAVKTRQKIVNQMLSGAYGEMNYTDQFNAKITQTPGQPIEADENNKAVKHQLEKLGEAATPATISTPERFTNELTAEQARRQRRSAKQSRYDALLGRPPASVTKSKKPYIVNIQSKKADIDRAFNTSTPDWWNLIRKVTLEVNKDQNTSLRPEFIMAMIAVESSFNPRCNITSGNKHSKYKGLLQISDAQVNESLQFALKKYQARYKNDATAKPYFTSNGTVNEDPLPQLYIGISLIAGLWQKYGGDEIAIAYAHHAGSGDYLKYKEGTKQIEEADYVYAYGLQELAIHVLERVMETGKPYSGTEQLQQLDKNIEDTVSSNAVDTPDAAAITENATLESSLHDFINRPEAHRLVQAFPAFFVVVMDEGRWFGYERLWDHFYGGFGINSIEIVQSRKDPIDVATIVFSNVYRKLTSIPQFIAHQKRVDTRQVWTAEAFLAGARQLLSGAPNEDMKRRWREHMKALMIRPGARLHIRMGFGADASKLPVKFNGVISEVPIDADAVQVIALGDGYELSNPIPPTDGLVTNSTNGEGSTITNTGFLNTPKEPRNIIMEFFQPANRGITNIFQGRFLSENPYGIIHFGRPDFSTRGVYTLDEPGINIYSSRFTDPESRTTTAQNWLGVIAQIWAPYQGYSLFGVHVSNATPWKVMESCRKALPDRILAVRPFEFRSTIFFGKALWPFHYEYKDGADLPDPSQKPNLADMPIADRMNKKAFSQFHLIYSQYNLISSNVTVSTENVWTNCQAKYTYGLIGTGDDTGDLLYADSDIFPETQRTKIISSGILSGPLHGFEWAENVPHTLLRWLSAGGWRGKAVKAAVNVSAANTIRDDIADMYQGAQLIIGDPFINPWDLCATQDAESGLGGVYQVKETVNHISLDGGYITAVSPDCLVSTIGKDLPSFAGSLVHLLKTYAAWHAYTAILSGIALTRKNTKTALVLATLAGSKSAGEALDTLELLELRVRADEEMPGLRSKLQKNKAAIKAVKKRLAELGYGSFEKADQAALRREAEKLINKEANELFVAAMQIEDETQRTARLIEIQDRIANALTEDAIDAVAKQIIEQKVSKIQERLGKLRAQRLALLQKARKLRHALKTMNSISSKARTATQEAVRMARQPGSLAKNLRRMAQLRETKNLELTAEELERLGRMTRVAGAAKLLGGVVKLVVLIAAGSIGEWIGRQIAARQCVIIMPLTIHGMEFSAGINGHAGSVVGDAPGTIDHVLAMLTSAEYAGKHAGIAGIITPLVLDFLVPGLDQGFTPDATNEIPFDKEAFDRYVEERYANTQTGNPNNQSPVINMINDAQQQTKIVTIAERYLTTAAQRRYDYGPWDCSAFVSKVLQDAGIITDRKTARGFLNWDGAQRIPAGSPVLPGDLIFFHYSTAHIGIYVGNNQYIHNSSRAGHLTKSKISEQKLNNRQGITILRVK